MRCVNAVLMRAAFRLTSKAASKAALELRIVNIGCQRIVKRDHLGFDYRPIRDVADQIHRNVIINQQSWRYR